MINRTRHPLLNRDLRHTGIGRALAKTRQGFRHGDGDGHGGASLRGTVLGCDLWASDSRLVGQGRTTGDPGLVS